MKVSIPGRDTPYIKGDPVFVDGRVAKVMSRFQDSVRVIYGDGTEEVKHTSWLEHCDYPFCGGCETRSAARQGDYLCITCRGLDEGLWKRLPL